MRAFGLSTDHTMPRPDPRLRGRGLRGADVLCTLIVGCHCGVRCCWRVCVAAREATEPSGGTGLSELSPTVLSHDCMCILFRVPLPTLRLCSVACGACCFRRSSLSLSQVASSPRLITVTPAHVARVCGRRPLSLCASLPSCFNCFDIHQLYSCIILYI